MANFTAGVILLWFGAIVDIPTGWILCDGNNGTPDLRNRFIPGAGDTYAVDETGGTLNHTHSFTGGGHTHGLVGGSDFASGLDGDSTTASEQAAGITDPETNVPPFHALAYIMKT